MRLILVSILALFIASDAYSQTSTIQTVAGGALPENTPGTSASLGAVNALAVDGAGNVFLGLPSVVLRLDAKLVSSRAWPETGRRVTGATTGPPPAHSYREVSNGVIST